MNIFDLIKDLRKVFLTLVFMLVFFIALSPPQDADMWWHLAAGKEMVNQGKILTTDIFSYTHIGQNWTNAFWLSDIILFLVYELGGYFGITMLVAIVAVLTMMVIYRHTSNNPFPLPLLIILLASVAIAPVWTARPQIFSFLLLAILDYGLNDNDQYILRRPWLLVLLFVLWANMHGGFIWGFLLLFAFIIGNGFDNLLKRDNSVSVQQLGHLSVWTLIAALAIAINPNGFALWKLPFYTVGVSIQSITEWSSPDFHRLDLHPILWLLFLIISALGTSRKPLRWSGILKVIGFAYMAFISQRSIGPFVLVAAPVAIESFTALWLEWRPLSNQMQMLYQSKTFVPVPTPIAIILNLTILGLFAFVIAAQAYSVSRQQQVHGGLPMKAVEWISANQPQGRMFNAYNWGGYLQWELPQYPVFIDGRADLYGEETITDWWSVVNATDEGVALLDSWQVNFVILEPGWPILEELSRIGWQVLYKDQEATIMGR
ncbi:MAG TPA: hypothetical protein VNA23_04035 [Anaerolineales bacterium]|nr:hypothetical protein [Anaerolineales bacterium]